jgi:hypothetical protein
MSCQSLLTLVHYHFYAFFFFDWPCFAKRANLSSRLGREPGLSLTCSFLCHFTYYDFALPDPHSFNIKEVLKRIICSSAIQFDSLIFWRVIGIIEWTASVILCLDSI